MSARHTATLQPERLRSGMTGNGGRFTPHNGRPDRAPSRNSTHSKPQTPYRVIATTASDYSTSVANNTTRVFREER